MAGDSSRRKMTPAITRVEGSHRRTVSGNLRERTMARHSTPMRGGTSLPHQSDLSRRTANALRNVSSGVAVAIGTTAVAASLLSRKKGVVLIVLAGVTAIAAARRRRIPGDGYGIGHNASGAAPLGQLDVARSITIGKTAHELYQRWCDPATFSLIMGGFATVHSIGDGRMHWRIAGPTNHSHEWNSEVVGNRPNEAIGWRSMDRAAVQIQGSVSFHAAAADRGTVATLRIRFDPPGGVLGHAVFELLGSMPLHLAADDVLRRFKSLVETGEVATTERQPAARADTH
jgi:uncharacterized membrane protein